MKLIMTKKRAVLALAVAVLAVALIITLAAVIPHTVSAVAPNGKTVVIDVGHGGADGGVVGPVTGVKESEINLGVAKSLRHFLREAGYAVVMTREKDVDLAVDGEDFKKSDMRARKKIIEDASPDLMVSIHQNFYPLRSVHGAQVFYAATSEVSKGYAERMQEVLNATLDSDRVAKSGDYYVLTATACPALLVECGFLSNAEEERKLVTPEYQREVAYSVYTGINAILTE